MSRWLTEKEYADETSVQYGRSPDGKLETRTWARQVGPNKDEDLITEYVYDDDTGELTEVKYYHDTEQTPDPDTHGIEYTYTRLGQHHTVADVVGTRTFAYNAYGELASETIDGSGGGLYSRVITRKHEESQTGALGRDIGFDIGTAQDPDQDYDVDYAYDAQGRLERIDGPGLPAGGAVYDRVRDGQQEIVSDLIATLTYKDGSANALASATRVYDDHRDLLESIENEESGTPVTISKYTYAYDDAGRRTSVVYTGSAFDPDFHVDFGYNDRGELTAADRRQGTTPGQGNHLVADKHAFDYTYDPIGNRITYNVDDAQTPTHYCANSVNQYDATGAAAGCATPSEEFDYDDDGNLIADGTMTYVWNAENRLIEAYPTTPAANDKKVEFKYDYLGRRVEKKVYNYDSGWSLEKHLKFVYEGWNVVLVLNSSGDPQRKYTWGLDLSGTMQGAGGIGGLLAVEEVAGTYAGNSYWFAYDGNGSVGQLLNADDQTLAAHYEYDPYGNIIVAEDVDSSDYVNANPMRFSTKWFDAEIGAYYYIFRYYAPRFGRWLNRDPLYESAVRAFFAQLATNSESRTLPEVLPYGDPPNGGIPLYSEENNLVRAMANQPINRMDALGLICVPYSWGPGGVYGGCTCTNVAVCVGGCAFWTNTCRQFWETWKLHDPGCVNSNLQFIQISLAIATKCSCWWSCGGWFPCAIAEIKRLPPP
ncbi:MAG: hypothetical protein JXA69_13380 [Phycisphaerae bacterium]|nr:hypothetical protein [Phycisphaerae bacterium]